MKHLDEIVDVQIVKPYNYSKVSSRGEWTCRVSCESTELMFEYGVCVLGRTERPSGNWQLRLRMLSLLWQQ